MEKSKTDYHSSQGKPFTFQRDELHMNPGEVRIALRNTFLNRFNSKKTLTEENLSLEDLRTYLLLRFVSYKEAASAGGISENRLHQFFMGYDLPKTSKILHRLAKGWELDVVKLTTLFQRFRGSYEEKKEAENDQS